MDEDRTALGRAVRGRRDGPPHRPSRPTRSTPARRALLGAAADQRRWRSTSPAAPAANRCGSRERGCDVIALDVSPIAIELTDRPRHARTTSPSGSTHASTTSTTACRRTCTDVAFVVCQRFRGPRPVPADRRRARRRRRRDRDRAVGRRARRDTGRVPRTGRRTRRCVRLGRRRRRCATPRTTASRRSSSRLTAELRRRATGWRRARRATARG